MGRGILFRWEDSDALKHHCGFCDRPLSHPSAKTLCFGTHAEPCFRFHQAMFMRNRGHTCDMCLHIEEHHYKRHYEMCEQIRSIYEICGESWTIVPRDEDRRGRSKTRGLDTFESDDRSSTIGDLPLKKRDKKEQKRQHRAASRSKVVTQEDIKYVDYVLHFAESPAASGNPDNPEEIEEIEQHLKYNAQCYNQGQKRSDIRQFGRIQDADINFGAEIDRVFDILRIAELIKRNEKNRGLRSKEQADFRLLVSEFKDQVITDLVHAKRDELEVRMRRAGFLRYTNRASYDIVANRYAEKDWKTGEKYRSVGSGSASSDSLTAIEEQEVEQDNVAKQETLRNLSTATLHDVDRRHIEHSHKKIGSNGLLEEVSATAETNDTPRDDSPKPPPSLRIVNTNVILPQNIKFHNPWKNRKTIVTKPIAVLKRTAQNLSSSELLGGCPTPEQDDGWQTVGPTTHPTRASGDQKDAFRLMSETSPGTLMNSISITTSEVPWHSLKPMRVGVIASMHRDEMVRRQMVEKLKQDDEQANLDAKSHLQERKDRLDLVEAHLGLYAEEKLLQKLQETSQIEESPEVEQAPVESRKKKDKKKKRETERRARRAAEKESIASKHAETFLDNAKADSPLELTASVNVSDNGLLDGTDQGLHSPSDEGFSVKLEGSDTADINGIDHVEVGKYAVKPVTERLEREPHVEDETSLTSWLRSLPSIRDAPTRRMEQGQEFTPGVRAKSAVTKHMSGSITSLQRKAIRSDPPKNASSSSPLPATKIGRHKDWVKFAAFTKSDRCSTPLFTSMHPAYNGHADTLFIGECPFEASGARDCPYHKTYCKCVDPVDAGNDKYIVYAESKPTQIGPFNYIQSEKLMRFFESQSETKGRLIIVDEDVYNWLRTEGRHWRIEEKLLSSMHMPKRLSWEVEDYVRGYAKGRILTQVEQFQNLADKHERLSDIGCRTNITKELLESLRKKCEDRPGEDAICYCRDNVPERPEDEEELVECMYCDCPIRFFHRRCVKKLGYDKVTTWYCGFCERHMSVAAQKALHEAHAMFHRRTEPDFSNGKYGVELRCVAATIDAINMGHCGGH